MTNPNQALAGSDAVVAHLTLPIPETLWHYTTFAGFQGIISSKTIWATEYRFLNDSEEFFHARTLVEKLVEEVQEFTELRFPARDTIRSAVRLAFFGKMVPYVAYPLLLPNQEGPILCRDVIIGPGGYPALRSGSTCFSSVNRFLLRPAAAKFHIDRDDNRVYGRIRGRASPRATTDGGQPSRVRCYRRARRQGVPLAD